MTATPADSTRLTSKATKPVRSIWPHIAATLKLAQVRLRIPVVLLAAAFVVGRWETIRNHWDRLTRPHFSESIASHAVSADTEYFCPMDPGILSDWPGRCGICNMTLVRRKRGEALALPDGVVARMQLSPYRIQLAGIQTAPAEFRPLVRTFESSAAVARQGERASLQLEIPARQASWVTGGLAAEIECTDLEGHGTILGQVQKVEQRQVDGSDYLQATIVVADPPNELRGGMIAVARVRIPMSKLEPFRSMPTDPPRLRPNEPRTAYVCPDHTGDLAVEPGRCPLDRKTREARALAGYQRMRWWCPMHPAVTAEKPDSVCSACGGMVLKPRILSYSPAGQVLSVPCSSVIDAGARKVVFIETMPGMFDGVEVVLGPRCGDDYPVVKGLEPGQRVAFAGAFLLDAETRLNPALASAYFGAGRGKSPLASSAVTTKASESTLSTAFSELAPDDRLLAERQKLCPVTNKPLGSMGTPARVVVQGTVVFLCCAGCEDAITKEPAKYLAKLKSQ